MINNATTRKVLIVGMLLLLVNTFIGVGYSYFDDLTEIINPGITVGDWESCEAISTPQEFYDFATSDSSVVTDYYCLVNDIDFSSFTWEYLSSDADNKLRGTFNGNNFTLSNITMETTATGTVNLSIFSKMENATIMNVNIENYKMGFTTAYFNSSTIQAGIFAGQVSSGDNVIENITIDNADVISNSINGAGGLVGQVQKNTNLDISDIKATNLTVLSSSKRAGGLISRVIKGTGVINVSDIDIKGSFAANNAISYTGSIAGTVQAVTFNLDRVVAEYNSSGSIDLADSTISYITKKYVGGFIGNNNASTIMTINDAFYTGELYGNANNLGSVLGRKKATPVLNNVYYSNVLFDSTYTASTASGVLNGTVVFDQAMPDVSFWNGFYSNFSSANSLWDQDALGRPYLIRD